MNTGAANAGFGARCLSPRTRHPSVVRSQSVSRVEAKRFPGHFLAKLLHHRGRGGRVHHDVVCSCRACLLFGAQAASCNACDEVRSKLLTQRNDLCVLNQINLFFPLECLIYNKMFSRKGSNWVGNRQFVVWFLLRLRFRSRKQFVLMTVTNRLKYWTIGIN